MQQYIQDDWRVSRATYAPLSFKAKVPGVVQDDLLNNSNYDLYGNDNESLMFLQEKYDWKYFTDFDLEPALQAKDHIELNFEGLDTYADVYLNDSLILTTNNMFLEYSVEVKELLKVEGNKLEIQFTSPYNHHLETVLNAPIELPSGCEDGEINVGVYSRKAPYQFGWDWGPRCVTVGPWKPISLRAWSEARLVDVQTETRSIEDGKVQQSIDIEIEGADLEGKILEFDFGGYKESILLYENQTHVHREITFDSSRLWWPLGHGEPTLIPLQVSILKQGNSISRINKTVGLRTVELVQEPDSIGTPYYFKINGVSVFCKGANYIPQHVMPHLVKHDEKEALLQKAVEANMNMIRIWGGGIYETEKFYSTCDALGLMVWQDFMYAGSIYPPDEEFRKLCNAEAEEQVKKFRNHPSIVLWCGNNELDVAFHNWGWQEKFKYTDAQNKELYRGYEQLFKTDFANIVTQEGNGIPYIHTSPTSNWGTPENFNHGSMHYWGVWHGKEAFSEYKNNVGRFMVEYGFQSFPDADLLSRYVPEDQWSLESEVIENRQRSYIGNGLISTHSEELFGKPKDFDQFIEYSQYTQAEAMRIAITAHRLNTGKCMGSLFWQLNDCWPGPSWSAIQSNGVEKPVYNEIKKLFSPVIAVIDTTQGIFSIQTVSDDPISRTLSLQILCFRDAELTDSREFDFNINYLEVKELFSDKQKKWDGKKSKKKFSYQLILREDKEVIFQDEWFEVPLNRWMK
ncbi:MAG: glycoside hydrolase family 2 protein [Flavobacteriales bacterium]